MRVLDSLRRLFEAQLPEVHRARLVALFAAVAALIRGGELTLTRLGRAIAVHSFEKHGIKRVDRLLGNEALHRERPWFFRVLAAYLLRNLPRPVILVDWTEATSRRHCLLVAAVAFDGRGIPIYAETHPMRRLSHTRTEVQFFRRLREILPATCRPIVVVDAGFRPMTLKRIVALGWDFVGRIRRGLKLRPQIGPKEWIRSHRFLELARPGVHALGTWEITCAQKLPCELVLADLRSQAAKGPLRHGRRRAAARKAAASAREPWLLITSLTDATAEKVAAIYGTRMQIEETLRDTKNPRLGWSLEDSGSRSRERVDVLLLIGALASTATCIAGLAAELANLHCSYQANTITERRTLSLHMLGRRVLASTKAVPRLRMRTILRRIWRTVREHSP